MLAHSPDFRDVERVLGPTARADRTNASTAITSALAALEGKSGRYVSDLISFCTSEKIDLVSKLNQAFKTFDLYPRIADDAFLSRLTFASTHDQPIQLVEMDGDRKTLKYDLFPKLHLFPSEVMRHIRGIDAVREEASHLAPLTLEQAAKQLFPLYPEAERNARWFCDAANKLLLQSNARLFFPHMGAASFCIVQRSCGVGSEELELQAEGSEKPAPESYFPRFGILRSLESNLEIMIDRDLIVPVS